MSFLFIYNESHGFAAPADVGNDDYDPRYALSSSYPQFRDPDYSRGHVSNSTRDLTRGWLVADPASNLSSDIWFHFRSLVLSSGTSRWVFTKSEGTSVLFEIQISEGTLKITDHLANTVSASLTGSGAQSNFDVKINFTSGRYAMFQDGMEVGSGTQAWISNLDDYCYAKHAPSAGSSTAFTEMIIAENETTVGMRVVTLAPDALASDNTMTGDVSSVNEVRLNPDGMSTEDRGNFYFRYSDISTKIDMSKYEISAVSVSTVATSDVGFKDNVIQNTIRQNGNDHATYDFLIIDTTSDKKSLNTIYTLNPETNSSWTLAEVNALEAGIVIGQPDLEIRIANNGSLNGWRSDANVMGTILGGKDAAIADALYYTNDSNYLRLSPKVSSGGWYGSTSVRIHLVFEDGAYFVTNRISYESSFGGSFKSDRDDVLEAKFATSIGQTLKAWVETF